MADFAKWGVAVERGLGWPEGSFLHAYSSVRAEVNDLPIEASALGPEIVAFAHEGGCDRWTCSELLARLNERAPDARLVPLTGVGTNRPRFSP